MAKKKARPNPNAQYVRQAQDATDLRYGQEGAALKMLADSAGQSYLDGRSQSKSAAASIIAAADASRPGLADLLSRVGQYSGATTAKLAPAPGTGLHSEAAVQAANLGLTAQSAMTQLDKEKVRAVQAAAYQTGKLRDDYKSDLSKIQERGLSLQQEAGTYASDTLSKLLGARADRQVEYTKARKTAESATQQNLTTLLAAGLNPDGTVREGGAKDPAVIGAAEAAKQAAKPPKHSKPMTGQPGSATSDALNTFTKAMSQAEINARVVAGLVKDGTLSAEDAVTALTQGTKKDAQVPVLDQHGKPIVGKDGAVKTRTVKKGFDGVGDPVAARAALEIVLHGGAVSHKTALAIQHQRGIRIRDIGATVKSQRQIQAEVEARNRRAKEAKKNASNPIKDFYDRLNGH